jgi:hypothetical protein
MTPSELFKKYTFHDSLLEKADDSPTDKTAVLEIDFCYWQQNDYTDTLPETGILRLRFSGVTKFSFPTYPMNSDEIVRVRCDSENSVIITVYSDLTEEYHELSVTADSVIMETLE